MYHNFFLKDKRDVHIHVMSILKFGCTGFHLPTEFLFIYFIFVKYYLAIVSQMTSEYHFFPIEMCAAQFDISVSFPAVAQQIVLISITL